MIETVDHPQSVDPAHAAPGQHRRLVTVPPIGAVCRTDAATSTTPAHRYALPPGQFAGDRAPWSSAARSAGRRRSDARDRRGTAGSADTSRTAPRPRIHQATSDVRPVRMCPVPPSPTIAMKTACVGPISMPRPGSEPPRARAATAPPASRSRAPTRRGPRCSPDQGRCQHGHSRSMQHGLVADAGQHQQVGVADGAGGQYDPVGGERLAAPDGTRTRRRARRRTRSAAPGRRQLVRSWRAPPPGTPLPRRCAHRRRCTLGTNPTPAGRVSAAPSLTSSTHG